MSGGLFDTCTKNDEIFNVLNLMLSASQSRCTLCSTEIESSSLIPNHALRAAAAAVKHEDDRRLFHNAALRKRRKEMVDRMDIVKRQSRDNGDTAGDDVLQKGVQYPFEVNEKVVIKVHIPFTSLVIMSFASFGILIYLLPVT
ncbi:RING/U-box superfamily protein [Actinidia rufa]|uniref:RING/U-box superfamily protein n=1 Tax=Actinidia rufa TaxID=165716 RepID=A0A7J0GY20_9ERIC|nr:RING/U-box superfamily protein [Actinidia rufa]